MNAVNHMAQSESKENAIAKHKKETHIRMKKSCLEKCLISYKKKSFRKKKTRKSSIWIKNPVQPVWEKITQTHTPITHIHRSSYRTTPTKTDTCIHIVHGCLTKLFVEKYKKPKNKSLRHISANLLVT